LTKEIAFAAGLSSVSWDTGLHVIVQNYHISTNDALDEVALRQNGFTCVAPPEHLGVDRASHPAHGTLKARVLVASVDVDTEAALEGRATAVI
jgi:hypothetical protein